MKVTSLVLENFRIYEGRQCIDMSVPSAGEGKNMVVLGGKNGYGKTTILLGLVWCLYGEGMKKVDAPYYKEVQSYGNYTKYMQQCLNRHAKQQGIRCFSVGVTFEGVEMWAYSTVSLTRRYDVAKDEEVFEVLLDGRRLEEVNGEEGAGEEQKHLFVQECLMPLEVARFFFFDAEKIVSLSRGSEAQEQQNLGDSYSRILGLKVIDDLRLSLEELADDYRKRSATQDNKQRLIDLEASVKRGELRQQMLVDQLNEVDQARSQKEETLSEIQRRLEGLDGGVPPEKIVALRHDLEAKQSQLAECNQQWGALYEFMPFAISGDVLGEVVRCVRQEEKAVEGGMLFEQITVACKDSSSLTMGQCPTEFQGRLQEYLALYETSLRLRLRKLLLSEESEGECTSALQLNKVEVAQLDKLISYLTGSFWHQLDELMTKQTEAELAVGRLEKEIRRFERDQADGASMVLQKQREALEADLRNLQAQRDGYIRDKTLVENELKTNRQKLSELRKQIDALAEYDEKLKHIRHLLECVNRYAVASKQQAKQTLERGILGKLHEVLHKQGFVQRVEVQVQSNGDLLVALYDAASKRVVRSSLSMGERQLYTAVLVGALIEASAFDFPVFIDSPLQKLDAQHAQNVLKYLYPTLSEQVVFFPLVGKEFSEAEYELVADHVVHTYVLEQDSHFSTTVRAVTSSELFQHFQRD